MALLIPNLIAIGIASVTTIIDTAFASYLSDHASIAAIKKALLLYGLPSVLLASAVGQALLPQITTHASQRCYLRMRQTILKIGRGTMLLSAPAALILYFLGKPAICFNTEPLPRTHLSSPRLRCSNMPSTCHR